LNFLDSFSKNTQISNFIKIRPVGAENSLNIQNTTTLSSL